jgi:hypothetical protein
MEQNNSKPHDLKVAIPLLSSKETSFSTNTIDRRLRIRAPAAVLGTGVERYYAAYS